MSHAETYVPSSRRGVLHMCPVPRNMRPTEIQSHFNRFGQIRRMKFVPYPKKERWPGGPLLPLRFREGWMEFNEVASARRAAETMNGQAVDVKRLRKCFGELWVVKFMGEDFSWDDLIEEKEEKRRHRRASEVQARRSERDANEAYRRLVLSSLARKSKKPSANAPTDAGDEESEPVPGTNEKTETAMSSSTTAAHRPRAPARGLADDDEPTEAVAGDAAGGRRHATTTSAKRARAAPAGGSTSSTASATKRARCDTKVSAAKRSSQ